MTWIAAALIHLDIAPVEAMRLISIASGAVVAVATAVLAWRWWSPRVAIVSGALVASVPYFVVHSAIGIYDPFVAACSMVALALQLELARRPRLDIALLLGLTLGVTVLAKPTGALAVALLPASLVVFDWTAPGVVRRCTQWMGLVLVALFITACCWALTRMSPLAYAPHPVFYRTLSDFLADPFVGVRTVGPDVGRALWGYLTPPGVILAGWGLVRVIATRNRAGMVVAIWALGPIAMWLALAHNGYPRYGLQAIAPICLLTGVGAEDLWLRARRRFAVGWVTAAAVLAAVPAVVFDARVVATPGDAPYPGLDRHQYVTGPANRAPIRSAAETVVRRSRGNAGSAMSPGPPTVAELDGYGWRWATLLTLNGTHFTTKPRFRYFDMHAGVTQVNQARFVIVDGSPPTWLNLRNARAVGHWARPGGRAVTLYARDG